MTEREMRREFRSGWAWGFVCALSGTAVVHPWIVRWLA